MEGQRSHQLNHIYQHLLSLSSLRSTTEILPVDSQEKDDPISIIKSILIFWFPSILLAVNLLSLLPPLPSRLRWNFFSSFISITDLNPHQLVKISPPKWKQASLLSLSASLLLPSLADLSYEIKQQSSFLNLNSAGSIVPLLVWVSQTSIFSSTMSTFLVSGKIVSLTTQLSWIQLYSVIYLSLRTITRPVYQLLLLWTSVGLAETTKIWISVEANQDLSKFILICRFLTVIIILGMIYLTGSYPILDTLPCPNVAKAGSVEWLPNLFFLFFLSFASYTYHAFSSVSVALSSRNLPWRYSFLVAMALVFVP
jgi:hypothetical protein